MKKEDLVKMGLDEATAEKVAAASAEELKGFVPLTRFNEVNEAKKNAEDSLKERDKQIDGLKASAGDAEKLKQQIDELQKSNKAKDAEHAAAIQALKLDNAVNTALIAAKAKNLKAVKALLDLSKAELDADGVTVKGLAEQIKALQAADDSKFLFDAAGKANVKGAKAGQEGVEDGDKKADLSAMSYEELCQYLDEHPESELNE